MFSSQHPPGLMPLFLTEMWERLSYYGMRALLILFLVAPADRGGLGMEAPVAGAIYGLYTAGVYLAALPGGWVADRWLGARRAIWVGGILITAGHFTLALPGRTTFLVGLVPIVVGTGLLKPNISSLVGELYPGGDPRRDAGFTLFYLGINVGALAGPLVCGWLGERVDWHLGFGAAGVGMLLGLVQFGLTGHRLGPVGGAPAGGVLARDRWLALAGGGGVVAVVAVVAAGWWRPDPVRVAGVMAVGIAVLAVVYFGSVLSLGGLDRVQRGRVGVIVVLFLASALFWAGYEQAGSSLNLFAERYTARTIDALHLELPAGWFQSVPALFVIVLAPVVATAGLALARRGREPSLPMKFALGLGFLAAGFVVVAAGSRRALAHGEVWPTWLLATYLLHVLGELLLSPVGLSSVTRLAPPGRVGQMMGVWFLATSLGNLVAGLFAGGITGDHADGMPVGFLKVAAVAAVAGLVLAGLRGPVVRWIRGDRAAAG